MSKIRVLSEILANKIAAGEVVERPASVAKELVENSLDAGATKVEIEIAGAGRSLLRVLDNGEGMTRDDAILAFERHATSKLRAIEDLEAIQTFGFRGEALPSVAAVSRVTLTTRILSEPAGTEVAVTGGKLGAVRDLAWPGGTEVAVRDLFFNVPARRKFLKSDATETFHVTNLVQHYALANPKVAFVLVNNGRETIRVTPVETLRERAYQLLGPALVDRLVEVEGGASGMRVSGYVSNPQEQRTSREAQYLFVNGRFVRDRVLGRAIAEGYRSMMPSGTYPAAVLFLEVPSDRVDVNVHPAKVEVRFREEHVIRQLVSAAIRDALDRATRPVASFPKPEIRIPEFPPETRAHWDVTEEVAVPEHVPHVPYVPAAPRAAQPDLGLDYRSTPTPPRVPFAPAPPHTAQPVPEPVPIAPLEPASPGPTASSSHRGLALADDPLADPRGRELSGRIRALGQIRESFIVATDEESLLLIDQHVAHERILFERFRDARLGAEPLRQQLLLPETIDLTPAQASAFERLRPELEAAGFDVLMLSGRTVALSSVPAELPPTDARSLLLELLDAVESGRGRESLESVREEIAASLACRAAIKINMPLGEEKMLWLIDELLRAKNPWTCPHGRPVILRFPIRDIERQFLRP